MTRTSIVEQPAPVRGTVSAVPPSCLAHFFRLLAAGGGSDSFNPWTERDPRTDGALNGPVARRERLRAHLSVRPARILVGEAAGYQGCHVSGIAFTSERLLIAGAVPRVAAPASRLSTRHVPWSEPSATTVWKALHELGVAHDTVLWNAFPWHPHAARNLQSNRTPARAELARGLPVLAALLNGWPDATVFAVGRHAQRALDELGCAAVRLRHPSMGGAAEFARGLRDALRSPRPAAHRWPGGDR